METEKRNTRRKPTKMKELQGTRRADREAAVPIEFESLESIPMPPDYFGEIAENEWYSILKGYQQVGIFSVLDIPAIRIYCKAVEDLEMLRNDISNGIRDIYTVTPNGLRQVSAEYTFMNRCQEVILKYGEKLGLNPASRTKISSLVSKPKDVVDAFEEYLSAEK